MRCRARGIPRPIRRPRVLPDAHPPRHPRPARPMSVIAALLVAGIGVLIGTVGLGGFLLVPVLVYLEGASVRDAVVVAALAFLTAGLLSFALAKRRADLTLRPHHAFLLSTAPGAILGALVVSRLVDGTLAIVIAGAFALAGIAEWFGLPRDAQARRSTATTNLAGGLATGFGSALTGTSGPMVAMPLLAWLGLPIRQRIVLGQIAQVPIALGATLAFLSLREVPLRLAAFTSLALCAGLLVGALTTPAVGAHWLRRVAALLMLGAAASMLVKAHG
ncbi:MAG: sulfite exporter TauE/SafE family protein [Casimicrobiaceae bacterium]